jgi:DNA-binding transcriptional MerR regulator
MTAPNVLAVSIDEAAAKLGRNPKTIRKWIAEGKLQAEKVKEDGRERWYVVLDNIPNNLQNNIQQIRGQSIQDLQAEELAVLQDEIADLKEQHQEETVILHRKHDAEVAQLTEQLKVRDAEIEDLNRRLAEFHDDAIRKDQTKQLEQTGREKRWQFWKR